ncbi:MAG: tripartite tricarboxylate transporter substrate binding protein [Treponema sp.]|nr:tripartite tricarboxylate transporter substrate binding protein [Treponema sp.]
MKRFVVFGLLVCLALPLFARGGSAPSGSAASGGGAWTPTRPIELVVPYAAGGSSDLLGRAIEKMWPKFSSQPMRVVDKPGGGGVTGSVYVANSTPDGYTLVLGYGSGCDMSMPYLQQLEYDPFKVLDPVCLISIHPVMVAIPSNSEFKTLADIIAWTKTSGKPATFASSTANGTVDLVLQAFAKKSGANITIIPTDGTAQSITMLISGQTQAAGAHPPDVLPQYQAGRIKLIGVATDTRDTSLPEVPTFKEQGINFSAIGSIKGVAVPKNTPDSIKKYYEATFKKMCDDPEFKKLMTDMAQPIIWMNTADFTTFFKQSNATYKQLIEDLGLAYYQQKK